MIQVLSAKKYWLTCKSVGINICRKPESRVPLCETNALEHVTGTTD